jgi:hypothetical protein
MQIRSSASKPDCDLRLLAISEVVNVTVASVLLK